MSSRLGRKPVCRNFDLISKHVPVPMVCLALTACSAPEANDSHDCSDWAPSATFKGSMRTDVIAGPRLGRLLYGLTDNVLITAVPPRL